MQPDDAIKAIRFAEGLSKVKRAHDRHGGTILTAAEVDGLIWGIQCLREASKDAATDVPA